jgi:hypothetical protein
VFETKKPAFRSPVVFSVFFTRLDWEANVDPLFKDNHYIEPVPVADTRSEGYMDRWIVTGEVEDLVVLRYFGPDAHPDALVGAHRR